MIEKKDSASQLETSPEKKEFSGSYGFVIKPDSKTQEKAQAIAIKLAPGAEFQTTIPHITLYHGRIEHLPLRVVKEILAELKEHRGESLTLDSFEVYGGNFLFWDVKMTDILPPMHKKALSISAYLEKDGIAMAHDEGLKMTSKELDNIMRYGHPLVLERYVPHITLAYDSHGLTLSPQLPLSPWRIEIDDVIFAEMGKYGAVARIVDI